MKVSDVVTDTKLASNAYPSDNVCGSDVPAAGRPDPDDMRSVAWVSLGQRGCNSRFGYMSYSGLDNHVGSISAPVAAFPAVAAPPPPALHANINVIALVEEKHARGIFPDFCCCSNPEKKRQH